MPDETVLPEYDFTGGVRGKHSDAYRQGHTVKIHKRDGSVEIHHFTPEEGTVMLEPAVQEATAEEGAASTSPTREV